MRTSQSIGKLLPELSKILIMKRSKRLIPKELSWLSFNERVLQEALDANVPEIERVRFLGIFSNNLDEFFRVRVSDLKRNIVLEEFEGKSSKATRKLLAEVQEKVVELQEQFDVAYNQVLKDLAKRHIEMVDELSIPPWASKWVEEYFKFSVKPFVTPIILTKRVSLTKVLKEELTYLFYALKSVKGYTYAMVEVPTNETSRFIVLPRQKGQKKKRIMLLDSVIRANTHEIFGPFLDFDSHDAYSMKLTRDAEFGLEENIDASFLDRMSLGVKQRLTAEPVRLVHDRKMPAKMVALLKKELGITELDATIAGGRYHNFRDYIRFPNVSRAYLEYDRHKPVLSRAFESARNAFDAIRAQDILLYYPIHSFVYFTELLRQAATDPTVEEISISIYRLADNSRVVKYLVDAAENGTKVTVYIELKARFDEEANIEWAKDMTEQGIRVEFGVPNLKNHSKTLLIKRREDKRLRAYGHIGTGNFHEGTANTYTDLSLFTSSPVICRDIEQVFQFLTKSYVAPKLSELVMSPLMTRQRFMDEIDQEIEAAARGNGFIALKLNNLEDPEIIEKLYEASQAGVKARMIVRGMCCLRPGVEGLSENIKVRSIVDRYLEHARLMIFGRGDRQRVYISSADWMTRNFDYRVEVTTPILDPKIGSQIEALFESQWSDTTKARVIDQDQSNRYHPRGNKRKIQSQVELRRVIETWV